MNSTVYSEKLKAVAQILEGRVADERERVEICVKGIVLGFPAKLEAMRAVAPFGVSYHVETGGHSDLSDRPFLKLVLTPRYMKGFLSLFSRFLVFESKGQKLGNDRLDSLMVASANYGSLAKQFVEYPGVSGLLLRLEDMTKFNELIIRTDAGLYLSQPTPFVALDLNVCRETFRILGELGQIIFESFS